MLRQSSSKKGSRIVWDEDNLKVNAEIQKEFSGIKVDEPKTPFHRPVAADDELHGFAEDMNPLELDEDGLIRERSVVTAADAAEAKATVMTALEYVMSNGGADYSVLGDSLRRGVSSSSDAGEAGSGLRVEVPSTSGASDDGGQLSSAKKRRFAELRKQHYNMKDALQQARRLLSNDDEKDEDEDVDDDEQDSATNVQPYTAAAAAADDNKGAAARASASVPHMAANGDAAAHGALWQQLSSSSQQQQAGQPQKHWQDQPGGDAEDMDGS